MAECEVASPQNSKTVLVCFGERKRPVTYTVDENEKESLLAAAREVFTDVDGIVDESVVQVKNEQWGGEFVDLKEDEKIPDRAVLRVVTEVREVVAINIMYIANGQLRENTPDSRSLCMW